MDNPREEQFQRKLDQLSQAFEQYMEAERAASRICISAVRAQAMINLKHRLDPILVDQGQQNACELVVQRGAEFDALCREAATLLISMRNARATRAS